MMKILFDGRNLTAECTHKKGVYCWLNTTNGKKYIGLAGGSKGLKGRLSNELGKLRIGSHHNTVLLGSAVKKYGLDVFVVYLLLETDDTTILGVAEQAFIKMYDSMAPGGYNLTEGGAGTIGHTSVIGASKRRGVPNPKNAEHRAKTYKLKNPLGEIVSVTNISSFCRAYGLVESSIRNIIAGKGTTHKGWSSATLSPEKYAKSLSSTAFFVSPEGELVKVTNIKRFALEVGVPQASLNHVWREKLHYNTCKGWRKASEEEINMYNCTKDKFWNFDRWDNK